MKIEIKSRFSGNVLFGLEIGSLKLALEAAVKSEADLSGANLYGANLREADLRGANLHGAKQRIVQISTVRHQIVAIDDMVSIGCHKFKLTHWLEHYQQIGKEEGYSDAEIELYGKLLKALEK